VNSAPTLAHFSIPPKKQKGTYLVPTAYLAERLKPESLAFVMKGGVVVQRAGER
jgi:hypothetical protein